MFKPSNARTRRDFLSAVGAVGTGIALRPLAGSVQIQTPKPGQGIMKATLGDPIQVPDSAGDTWSAAWADDGELYVSSDDTQGFKGACNSNLAISRLTGDLPALSGSTVNCMKEFGGGSETLREDGGMWKACGLTCVDGVLYLAVSRHLSCPTEPGPVPTGYWDGRYSPFWIQEAWDSSIIKSTDHGKTWSPAPRLGHAMFPGRAFSTPFFVQYGKDGAAEKDDAGKFVYAVSNDGAWNNGNWMILGRVPRNRIARLDASDWEFVHGYDDKHQPIWRPRWDNALYTFRAPGRASMTGIHYLRGIDLYVMPQWHYPFLDDPSRRFRCSRLELYQAPAPWGPWTLFLQRDFDPQSWYNPCIPSKFISDDGRRFWLFVAGDFLGAGKPTTYYALWMIPVTVEVQ